MVRNLGPNSISFICPMYTTRCAEGSKVACEWIPHEGLDLACLRRLTITKCFNIRL
jgi:hypothetical protein